VETEAWNIQFAGVRGNVQPGENTANLGMPSRIDPARVTARESSQRTAPNATHVAYRVKRSVSRLPDL
jgi:hypothetical protein